MVALMLISGHVEVYHNEQWGTVCDDYWDINDATVACRQLGYSRAVFATKGATFGEGSGPIHYVNMNCIGSEVHLADCPYNRVRYRLFPCTHFEDAGVVCEGKPCSTQMKGNLRL